MTRYFIDTEFIEDGVTIDLISIGIVSEDGREYYACNDECDLSKANDWVKGFVLPTLPSKHLGVNPGNPDVSPATREDILTWKTKDRIALEVAKFCNPSKYGMPVFWGWCCAYDFVAFCQLFGTMMDLPSGFPHYFRDLQFLFDIHGLSDEALPQQESGLHNALEDARHIQKLWNFVPGPK